MDGTLKKHLQISYRRIQIALCRYNEIIVKYERDEHYSKDFGLLMYNDLSIRFLRAWERAVATSSESPGDIQTPDATTSSKQIKIIIKFTDTIIYHKYIRNPAIVQNNYLIKIKITIIYSFISNRCYNNKTQEHIVPLNLDTATWAESGTVE